MKKYTKWLLDHMAGTYISLLALMLASTVAFATTTYVVHNVPSMTLKSRINATQTTGITINPPKRNGVAVSYPTLTGGVLELVQGTKTEHIYYSAATVDSDYIITLTGTVIRNLDWNDCTEYVSDGDGQIFTPGADVKLVNDCRLFNFSVYRDRSNTMTGVGKIQTDQTAQTWLRAPNVTSAVRSAFTSPQAGDMIFNTTTGVHEYYDGSSWIAVASTTGSIINATASGKGLVQLATTTDHLASTATGTTGAPLAVWVANLVSSHKVYTPAYAFCGSGATQLVATWAGTTNASFRVTVDGTVRDVTALDFTGITSMTGAAAKMQTALRAVTSREETITWTADGTSTGFTVTSANTTSGSAISLLSAVGAGTGTDISGAGATAYMDCDSGSAYAAITAAVKDITADAYKVPILGSGGVMSADLGGSGSGNLSQSGLLIGNGSGDYMTLNPCADNYVVTSDGTSWGCELVTATTPKSIIADSTGTGTSSTAVSYFDDQIHTISGGTLSAGDIYEIPWDAGIRLDSGYVDVHLYVDGKDAGFCRKAFLTEAGGDKRRPHSGIFRFTVRDADATGSIMPGGFCLPSVPGVNSGTYLSLTQASDGTDPDAIGSINFTTDTEIKLAVRFSASDAQHTAVLKNFYPYPIKR